MQRQSVPVIFGALLAISVGLGGVRARAAATPTFTISASNVTMPTSGNGSIPIALTSVNGYAGNLAITDCSATNSPAGAKLPTCAGFGGPLGFALTANATVKGSLLLIPPGGVLPPSAASLSHRLVHGGAAGLALASVLLFGLSGRRRAARWLILALFALGTLTGLAGISACGGNSNAMTPGTYSYAITATDNKTGTSVSTSTSVIVP